MSQVSRRVLVLGGVPHSLINFRGPLLQALANQGHVVFAGAAGNAPDVERRLQGMGVAYCPVRLSRAGLNPWHDLGTVLSILRLLMRVRPDVLVSYTIKPVIYGSLVARLCGVPRIYSIITGLGYALQDDRGRDRCLRAVAGHLYRAALRVNDKVFFQNPDDREFFLVNRFVGPATETALVNGSGVDVDAFSPVPLPTVASFLMIARLLRDKGVCEYVEAARRVKTKYPASVFRLVGERDPNPACVSQAELEAWTRSGVIDYLGPLEDVRPALAACSVYVLPSYREGLPRTVLEAMAMGRPIITTQAPGCRETVRLPSLSPAPSAAGLLEGENGFLVPVRDAQAVARAMERFLADPALADRMGLRSRQIAVERFDAHRVNRVLLEATGLLPASRG